MAQALTAPAWAQCVGTISDSQSCGSWTSGNLSITGSGTISDPNGLSVSTTAGTLTNDGLISGADTGIGNRGTIGALTNNGRISSSAGLGISNNGFIGTLNNTGTISGSLSAILYTGGTIGAITNSGLIAGTISNTTVNNLTINGGTGSTFGTLTGYSGGLGRSDAGTIDGSASNSNLVFSSGNLLLNDNIALGAGNVFVNNATLKLVNPIAIGGSYIQAGGGLLIAATNSGASYGYLTVSGNASVSSTRITISGSGLTAGETFTIVRAGDYGAYDIGPGGGADTGTITGTSDLSASLSVIGKDLVVTLVDCPSCVSSDYQQKGAPSGSAGGAMGGTLDKVVAAGNVSNAFQTQVLDVINSLSASAQATAIKQLAPTQNAPSLQMTNNAASAVLGAVEQHQQTAMAYDPVQGKAAGSDSHDSALWGQMLGGGAVRGGNAEADGYRTTDFGLAAGIDHRFTDNAMGGVALSWLRAATDGADTSSGSTSTLDSYQMTLYGTWRGGPAFVDGQAGVGYNRFDQKRAIPFLGSTASADYGGEQYLVRALAGYDVPLGGALAGTTVTPLAGLAFLRSVNDAYMESGAGAAGLSVDRRGVNSVTQELGGKLGWSLDTGFGAVKPEVRAEWLHDYTKGPVATSGLLSGQTFATTTPRTASDGVQVGLAATLNTDDALSFRAEYQGEARTKYQSHTGMIKAVWGF